MNRSKHRSLCAACALAMALVCALPPDARADEGARIQQDMPASAHARQYAPQPDTALAHEVLAMVNSDRAARSLPAMRMDAELCAAAYERAQEIARSFSHTRPDGSRFSTICEGAYAENIARGQRSAARVMAAWMSSPGHRKNILNPRYDAIGICALEQDGVMHWVQLFGRDG
ncbi:MAG: CAP domain-containing protein [Candidatus Fimadaptatus sp.]